MKVMHIRDIAFVATTLVDALNSIEGVEAIFFDQKIYSMKIRDIIKNNFVYKKLMEKEEPDILHIHFLQTGLYVLLSKTYFIIHVHGSDVRGIKELISESNIKNKVFGILKKKLLKKAKLVLYSTPDLKNDLDDIRNDAIFLPNPVKQTNFIKTNYEFKDNRINLLFFSSLSDQKGADIAFPALEIIKGLYKEKVNIICINFGYQKEKYGNFDFVNYIDKVEHENIDKFISQFDIIIGQLKAGAIGVSELEVMMQGIPLISYFKYNEFYEEPCPLISCNTPEGVVNSVEELVKNESLRKEIGVKQVEWVNRYHSDRNVALELLNLYKQL